MYVVSLIECKMNNLLGMYVCMYVTLYLSIYANKNMTFTNLFPSTNILKHAAKQLSYACRYF